MNSNMRSDEVIDLRNLWFYMLRKWRLILMIGLIGAVLFGSVQGIMLLTAVPEAVMSEEEIEAAEETIADNEENIEKKKEDRSRTKEELASLYAAQETYDQIFETAAAEDVRDSEKALALLTISEKIRDLQSQITSKLQRIDTVNSEIEALREKNAELQESIEERVELPGASRIVSRTIVGLLFGALLACMYIWLRYYTARTMRSEEDLSRRFGIPVLASLYNPKTRSGKIDCWIEKRAGTQTVNPERQYVVAATKLKVLAEEQDILVTGTVDRQQLESVAKGLMDNLVESQRVTVSEDPVRYPEVLLQNVRNVVLVENVNESDMTAVEHLVEFLELSDRKIVGAVVL